jgi:hypothetical protein
MVGPLRDAGAGDPRVSTINARKRRWQAPWRMLTKNLGAPTINARKRRRRAPDPVGGLVSIRCLEDVL